MSDRPFQILVIRLLAAILAGQNWKSRRTEVVLKDADKWVAEKQQNEGIVPTLDHCQK